METIGKYKIHQDLQPSNPGHVLQAEYADPDNPDATRAVVLKLRDDPVENLPTTLDAVDSEYTAAYTDTFTNQGKSVLVRRWVEGRSVDQLLEDHLPDRTAALRIACDIARGLKALHHAGFAHGRLHGGNVIVGEHSRAVLVDGAVERISDSPLEGEVIAADLAGLAYVIYQLVTGQSREVVERSPQLSLAGLPGVLRMTIERLLGADSDERFHTAAEALSSLEAIRTEGSGLEVAVGQKRTFSPRQYLSLAILMLLLIILWFVLSTTWPHK